MVTINQVLQMEIQLQHKTVLSGARELLSEVESMVKSLERDRVPIQLLNAFTYQRLIADHAKLRTLLDCLDNAVKCEEKNG